MTVEMEERHAECVQLSDQQTMDNVMKHLWREKVRQTNRGIRYM